MKVLPLLLIGLSTAISLALSVRAGALALALGLALLALLIHLQRGSRSPWRSQRSDLLTVGALSMSCALLALLLP